MTMMKAPQRKRLPNTHPNVSKGRSAALRLPSDRSEQEQEQEEDDDDDDE